MSLYICDHCNNMTDADTQGCNDWQEGIVCDDCIPGLEYEQEQKDTARTSGEGE